MKKNNKKGFTLAELLIVVAIIAVLVAVAIPVFTTQLERSREATDVANVRSAYAALMADYIATGSASGTTVTAQQTQDDWQGTPGTLMTQINGVESPYSFDAKTASNEYSISINASGYPVIN